MSNRSRRTAVLFSAAAIVAASLFAASPAGGADVRRSYATRNATLQLGNEQHIVRAADGGYVRGEVVVETGGGAGAGVKKHIGSAVVEPIQAVINVDDFVKFLQQQLENPTRVDGALAQTDYQGKTSDQVDFKNAILTEVDLPVLSATSKDPCAISITLLPESVARHKGSDNVGGKVSDPHKKKATSNMFRVDIPGVNAKRVSEVEAITLKRKVATDAVGEARDYQKAAAGAWDVSNIVLHVSASDAADFISWQEDFVIKGNNSDSREKTLTLDVLDSSGKSPLITFQASNVGIISVSPEEAIEDAPAGKESVRRYRVELYAERMTIGGNSKVGGESKPAGATGDSPSAAASPAPGDTTPAAPDGSTAAETPKARTQIPAATQPRLRRPRQ
jgi:phage tail-like protein